MLNHLLKADKICVIGWLASGVSLILGALIFPSLAWGSLFFIGLAISRFLYLHLQQLAARLSELTREIERNHSQDRSELDALRFSCEKIHSQVEALQTDHAEEMKLFKTLLEKISLDVSKLGSDFSAVKELGHIKKTLERIDKYGTRFNRRIEIVEHESRKAKESTAFLFEKLFTVIPKPAVNEPETITVVIGIRDRLDYRLRNALKSIRNQNYPQSLITIKVIDYGSQEADISPLKSICHEFSAEYIRVARSPYWNRAHCLNIGIKSASTKYLLTSDVDIVFGKSYISSAIEELRKNSFQVIYGEMLDSEKGQINAATDIVRDFEEIKSKCLSRSQRRNEHNYVFGMSIICGLTGFFKEIAGLDEKYLVWGSEDDDIVQRFLMIGLKLKKLPDSIAYIHQWHEVAPEPGADDYAQKNKDYFESSYQIRRNPNGWGETLS